MADAVSPQVLSALIASIYDCALDPDRWEATLAEIRDELCCFTAILHLNDNRGNRTLIYKTVGLEPWMLGQLARHIPEANAVLAQALASWPSLDEPHVCSRHLSRAYLESSPYVRECWKPNGIVDVLQYFLIHTPSHFAGLGFTRQERYGVVTDREIALGGLLLPHLRRAVTISNVLDAATIERARMVETLDALSCGVVLADEHGAILHANRAAGEMLSNGGPIRSARNILGANAPSAAKELRCAIKLAAKDEAGIGKTGLAIRLTEPDRPPVFAHVLPMSSGDLRTRFRPDAAAAVFIGTAPDAEDAAGAVARAYGLTPAETRVLASLLAGRTLAGTADALGIASTTAKMHLDNIFGKTGVSRQAELMLLAARAAPPARSAV